MEEKQMYAIVEGSFISMYSFKIIPVFSTTKIGQQQQKNIIQDGTKSRNSEGEFLKILNQNFRAGVEISLLAERDKGN